MMRFMTYAVPKTKSNKEQKIQILNKMNLERVMVRFYMDESDFSISADYYLSYKGGITPIQIIDCYRKFQGITQQVFSKEEYQNLFFG